MKIAVTPFSVSSIEKLAEKGADIFILGNEKYANRLVYSFSTIEITEAKSIIKRLNKELYISVNSIVFNSDLEDMERFLEFVKELEVDGIIFCDLGVYMIAKRLGIETKLIYNPETLNTNYYDTHFWNRKHILGLTISKEITLDDINEICEKKETQVSIVGHGHLNMFHSRRPLIENFFKYTKEDYDKFINNRNLKIIEEIRNEEYPIFQDLHGTHIFREKALESYQEIQILKKCIDVFIIDGIFKDTNYLLETVGNYNVLLSMDDSLEKAKKFSKLYEKDHDSGFLYKKTVYDKYE